MQSDFHVACFLPSALMMRRWSHRWLVAIAVLIAIRRPCDRKSCRLGRSPIRVEDTQTLWVLLPFPIDDKDGLTVLHGPARLHELAIDQQLRARLDIAAL